MNKLIFLLIIMFTGCTKEPIVPDPLCWTCEFQKVVTNLKTMSKTVTYETYYPCGKSEEQIRIYEQENYIYWENLNVSNEYTVKCKRK